LGCAARGQQGVCEGFHGPVRDSDRPLSRLRQRCRGEGGPRQRRAREGARAPRDRACPTAAEARAILARGELGMPIVVKADGLAAGKGVVVAPDAAGAEGGGGGGGG